MPPAEIGTNTAGVDALQEIAVQPTGSVFLYHTVRDQLLLHMQALTTPPSQLGMTDTGTPGLQLAVACAASLYFLRQNKRLGLGECGSPVVFASCDACSGFSRKLQLPGQQQQPVGQQWLHHFSKNI